MDGKTVLVVAHRLSTIANLDRILVFEHGRIVEDGSHSELLRRRGLYAQLWNRQSDGFLPDDDPLPAVDPPLEVPPVEELRNLDEIADDGSDEEKSESVEETATA